MSSTVLTLPSWKQEPLSPPNNEESAWGSSSEEALFYATLEQNTDVKFETDFLSSCLGDNKAEVASQLLEDLEKLVDLDELIKEEPFFLDVKMLPVLDDLDHSPYQVKIEPFKSNSKSSIIINEFDSVPMCNMIECVPSSAALTPPQSPPCETTILTTLKPLVAPHSSSIFNMFQDEQQSSVIVPEKQLLDNVLVYQQVEYPAAVTPQPDIAHELAVVDELVRSRVENMQWSSSGPSSPCSNSSTSSYDDSSSSSDPEWVPETVDNLNTPQDEIKTPRKRSKPYSRTVEDKKSRKKEQNKNAATRYRLKKKAEVEEILTEEKQLALEGERLSNQITDVQREIKYLKGLMRDLFKAKGLIN